ncbi:MAG: D-2-hydroxyacid dehydrogenase [Burkholderiales bacterium]|nr:MAG: D-2-hydroxyacid dehydrogenase [Burkholderiales bacterium]
MRVVYWARIGLARREVTHRLGEVAGAELVVAENLPELLKALPGAEGLVLYDAPLAQARSVVEALTGPDATVRWMHFLSAGREGFEAVGLPQRLQITWAAGGVSPTVAEHAMALLLALARRIPEVVALTAARRWDRSVVTRAISLEGRTMAIVGMGHVGRELARRARAFGMRVVAATRTPRLDPLLDEVSPIGQLHAVLARADAIVITIALAAQTEHLFDRAAFAACKPGALLVNVARGGVVEQGALLEALRQGHLGGAALDTTDPEPFPAEDPLWEAPNLLVSPHYAGGGSQPSMDRLAEVAAENLRRLIAGQPLVNLVSR